MTLRARHLLVALLAVPLLLAAGGVPAGADEHDTRVGLEVTALGPAVLRPDGTVSVRGTLRNDGPVAVDALEVRLFAWTPRLRSREAVDEWAEGRSGIRSGNRLLDIVEVESLAGGEQRAVELQAPASDLGLSTRTTSWGPRGLTVDVVDDDFDQLVVERGFTVWDPRPAADVDAATRVSLLAPLTAGPPDVTTGLLDPGRTAELTAEGGRLSRVVQVSAGTGAAWAVDPAVLASAAAEEQGWLAVVRDEAARRDVLALPRSDPDLLGASRAGTPELYELATRLSRGDLAAALGTSPLAEAAWPAGGGADDAAVALAARSDATVVVLGAGAHPPVDPEAGTLTGRSTVRAGDERLDGLLVDTALSTALTDATEGEEPALATARLLAETAVVDRAADAGDRRPHLLLSLPRDWDPDPGVAARVLQTLLSAPWLAEAPLRELLAAEPDDVDRAPVSLTDADRATELPPDGLRRAAGALASARELSSALTRPDRVLDGIEVSAVAASAVAWRHEPAAWADALDELTARVTALQSAVRVVEGSAVNVVSASTDLPVTVANDLEQDVDVVVAVQPRSPRLVARGEVEIRVPAGSAERVSLPVRAVANGNTDVVVSIRTPDGALLGEPVTVPVRVRADWETRGMLVAGAALALVLVVGLTRTIRRGRRRGATTEEARP
ncbi:MAG: DUF6049 family protein [Actinomycetes bacterium]